VSRMGPREPLAVGLVPRSSIDHLLWVANTRHGPGGHWFARVTLDAGDHDHLVAPEDAIDYLGRHHVPLPAATPSAPQLARLGAIREMVRALPGGGPGWTPEVLAILAATRFVADAGGGLAADGEGWDGFIGDLVLPLIQLMAVRERLRFCGNPHCRLIFLDVSRNGSRRWCDTAGCGNRDRVRRYRAPVQPA